MRVLFYLGDNHWSGTARAVLDAARGLQTRGHPVTIACCAGSRLDQLAAAAEIATVSISSVGWSAGGTLDLRKVLNDRFVEVAVVMNERDHLIVASAIRAAGRGAVLRRLPSFGAFDVQRSGRLALKLAASGLIVSTARELELVHTPDWPIPAAVVPLGVDVVSYDGAEPVARNRIGSPATGPLLVCSYDPSGRHKMAAVFRMLALLAPRHVNVHVAVVGPGSNDDGLRMHAAAVGVSPVVSFLGERDDERAVMKAATAGWIACDGDAAAYACLDFMSLRVPVIAERSPLMQHYVADGITGILLGETDPSHTASTVAAFLMGDGKRTAMGSAGRTRVQREFSDTATFDGLERAVAAAGDREAWTKT